MRGLKINEHLGTATSFLSRFAVPRKFTVLIFDRPQKPEWKRILSSEGQAVPGLEVLHWDMLPFSRQNSHCSKVGSLTVEIVPIAKDAHWHQNDYFVRLAVGVGKLCEGFPPWSQNSMTKHVAGECENLVYDQSMSVNTYELCPPTHLHI